MCDAAVLIGSPNRTRTCDPMINSHLLYQLSYRGTALSTRRSILGLFSTSSVEMKLAV